jgi:hypothetical protein
MMFVAQKSNRLIKANATLRRNDLKFETVPDFGA